MLKGFTDVAGLYPTGAQCKLMKDAYAVVCQIGGFQPFNTANMVRITAKVRQFVENLYEISIFIQLRCEAVYRP